jgi:hypothetical protein
MDQKREREVEGQAHEYLMQIALELEAAAAGARAAAQAVKENRREEGFPHVQQLYSRLNEATLLLDRFKRAIDKALAENI